MVRLAADEKFNNDIMRGLLRRRSDLDIVRVQDVGLSGADDSAILKWGGGGPRQIENSTNQTHERRAPASTPQDRGAERRIVAPITRTRFQGTPP